MSRRARSIQIPGIRLAAFLALGQFLLASPGLAQSAGARLKARNADSSTEMAMVIANCW